MSRYNVTIEVEVEAESAEQAWEFVATPVHNGVMSVDQPHWKHPIVNEPEEIRSEDNG